MGLKLAYALILAAFLPLSACAAEQSPQAAESESVETSVAEDAVPVRRFKTIYWSDGDSGRLDGLKFRLADIDAPETGRMGQRGGAKCELEIKRGFEAKGFIVELTRNAEYVITNSYGEDRYGRLVIDLSSNGVDVANAGVKARHLRDWPHKNGRALKEKPDWCAANP